ncbi:bis(5'-nucleosyl)-tetraphosphatase (symmetrical) YqeK [Bacillus sp. CLL-7-23]|uniref:bis(5'-nucleosyl)-tetraphosphatase (symmetrical) n=1 Tax=Bacillus changyiensis TaxID=3004103 RepID=A0ABT4X3J3_9BACI|nr:bis(5'-nucleosyl)-tetraphosphatase (symmetrical) YqeK [Bacillus changyiensis]MDA7026868.1 bis(5'-nucleosyl)-tetraphosphatase (symmetrical) YqeK [Bacillus changyiensis]
MKRDEALACVKKQLTEARYTHTIRVMETAIELANRFGADVNKAEIAAIFHDYAKFRPKEEMKQMIISEGEALDVLDFHPELWHAPAGAILVKKEAGITDEDVLSAIKYHTSGRPNMTLLEKVIYVADYIEPGRSFPGIEEVRTLAETNLDLALIQALKNTIIFLLTKNQAVFPMTIATYNTLIKQ